MHVEEPNLQLAEASAIKERLREAVSRAGGGTLISKQADVALSTLNGYLAGGEIKLSNLIKLARACDVSVEWLATGGPPRPAWLRILAGDNSNFHEGQAPLGPPVVDAAWLAKAIEIVDALGGDKLPPRERARRIAHSYELLTAPEADIPALPVHTRRGS